VGARLAGRPPPEPAAGIAFTRRADPADAPGQPFGVTGWRVRLTLRAGPVMRHSRAARSAGQGHQRRGHRYRSKRFAALATEMDLTGPCGVPKPRSRLLTCRFLKRPADPPGARQASGLCEVHDRYSAGTHPARVRHRRFSSRLTQERAREREAIMGERHRRSHSVLPRAVRHAGIPGRDCRISSDWSRPMRSRARSVLARMRRYRPVAAVIVWYDGVHVRDISSLVQA
jgi:hypothetical protein